MHSVFLKCILYFHLSTVIAIKIFLGIHQTSRQFNKQHPECQTKQITIGTRLPRAKLVIKVKNLSPIMSVRVISAPWGA